MARPPARAKAKEDRREEGNTMQRLCFKDTVDHVVAAINNNRELRECIASAVYYGVRDDRARFGKLCVKFALYGMDDIRDALPWLYVDREHVCAALDRILNEWER